MAERIRITVPPSSTPVTIDIQRYGDKPRKQHPGSKKHKNRPKQQKEQSTWRCMAEEAKKRFLKYL